MYFSPIGFSALLCLFFASTSCKQSGVKESHVHEPNREQDLEELVAGCVICHGVTEAQRGPILNGMDQWYLADQINKFRYEIRGVNPDNRSEYLMGVGARKVKTDVESVYLADWFSRQKPMPAIRTIRGDFEKGRNLYEQRCASCHAENGEGNQTLISPSLTRLEGWYFYQQMRKFREGERGYDPRDEGGKVMAAVAKQLSDYDIRNVVAYCVEAFGLPEEEPPTQHPSSPKSRKPF